MQSTQIAETKKVQASIKKAAFVPHRSTIMPPKPKPITAAIMAVIEKSELAIRSDFPCTSSGIIAIFAGIKKRPMQNDKKIIP